MLKIYLVVKNWLVLHLVLLCFIGLLKVYLIWFSGKSAVTIRQISKRDKPKWTTSHNLFRNKGRRLHHFGMMCWMTMCQPQWDWSAEPDVVDRCQEMIIPWVVAVSIPLPTWRRCLGKGEMMGRKVMDFFFLCSTPTSPEMAVKCMVNCFFRWSKSKSKSLFWSQTQWAYRIPVAFLPKGSRAVHVDHKLHPPVPSTRYYNYKLFLISMIPSSAQLSERGQDGKQCRIDFSTLLSFILRCFLPFQHTWRRGLTLLLFCSCWEGQVIYCRGSDTIQVRPCTTGWRRVLVVV